LQQIKGTSMSKRRFSKSLLLSTAIVAFGSSAIAQTTPTEPEDEIVVVGTQIKGSSIAGILPVTSLSEIDIETTGAVSGDELLAAIPQIGDVTFREGRFTGVNGARGDVGSVNLRGVGDGNTLVLLNGRRVVNHPGTQAVNQTPVVSVNSNALPVTGIKRLEVLRDGASAVYGSDAVAGVINTQLDDDYDGMQFQIQYGASEGTSLNETSGTLKWGKNFTQYGEFETLAGEPRIPGLGDDDFHIQPDSFSGCLVDLPGGVCADNGGSIDTALRLDRAAYRDIVGDTDRYNLFGFFNHELDNGVELFGEASYYHADYSRARETAAQLSSNRIVIPASGFYNPFGQDIRIMDLRPLDAGQRFITVKNDSFRLLGGARGNWNNWDWETAFLHSEAESQGPNTNLPNLGNNQATIDGFIVDVGRNSSTGLTLADAKFSNPAIMSWGGGDIGAAVGIEWRHESYEDDRDDRLDGLLSLKSLCLGSRLIDSKFALLTLKAFVLPTWSKLMPLQFGA